jgi:hypothetical protein
VQAQSARSCEELHGETVEELWPETPFRIIYLLDRALAFDKSARWPSAVAMRDAIPEGRVVGEQGGEPDRTACWDRARAPTPVRSSQPVRLTLSEAAARLNTRA